MEEIKDHELEKKKDP